jgi:uncharacterized protein YkwD
MITRRSFLLAAAALPTPSVERRVFEAINFQRVCKGSDPLAWDDRLAAAARKHCERMVALGFIGHQDPDFGYIGERLTRAGIAWLHCAENVFSEKNFDDPVAISVVSWMYSPGHRQSLLDPRYTISGVGLATGPGSRVYLTQNFIRPR